jgi:DNA-binding NarL/FixJ family response regulator
MNPPIQIVVVEDNPAYARSIQEIISISDGMECVSVYHSAEDCCHGFQTANPPDPDVILLDLKLPGKSGMSLIPFLRTASPQARILVLTSNDDYRTVLEAIQLGVLGYVLKDTPVAVLRQAILDVHDGGSVIDPQLSRLVLKAFQDKGNGDNNPLSPRERQVLELMALGYAKKDVASELGISYSAVALYTANIYEKLQVPNIAAAVSTAIRKGLI